MSEINADDLNTNSVNEDQDPATASSESPRPAQETNANQDKYRGRDNHNKPKREYIERIEAMTDEALYAEAEQKIWLSAYANNNPRSDYHWQADATYDECKRRGKPGIYQRAYEHNLRSVS